ncbi:MAG TPA: NPCBM/NEW2 domain-containing protein [Humisphaera sp.]
MRPFGVERLEGRTLFSTLPSGFTETLVGTGLTSPTAMQFAPDGRVFVTEQGGSVRVIKDGQLLPTPFVTVNADSTGERGLLGVTVDPDFATNHYLYVYYTSAAGESHNVVGRFVAAGDTAPAASEVQILSLPPVGGGTWHMGGSMKFGADGKLYVAVGDYQVPANAGSLDNPAGKILRINADGSIPADNPFYARTTGVNRAIYAMGMRNPFTIAVNPTNGMFFYNEVGQSGYEEVNLGAPGANYGWPGSEGPTSIAGFTPPIYSYPHTEGICVIGGAFYDGVPQVFPAQYQGKYFFGDFGAGWVRTLDPATKQVATFATGLVFPTGFATGSDGTLWYLSRGAPSGGLPNTGSVYKIAYDAFAKPAINTQPADRVVVAGEPASFQVIASGAGTIGYQWRRDGLLVLGATGPTYALTDPATLGDSGAKFDCIVSNEFGTVTTRAATLTVTSNARPTATITSPVLGTTFAADQTISYGATAADAEDGELPASAFTWQIDYHTGVVTRPFLLPTSGVTGGTFTVPNETPYTEPDVFFRITCTVTDSSGLAYTTSRDVYPRTATVTLTTNVPGAKVEIDGQPKAGPYVTTGVVGLRRTIGVPLTQTVNGTVYQFTGWSDGGAATHSVYFPSANTTYTANYVPRQAVYLSDLPFAGAPTNNWGPVERDRSNGEYLAGDGRPITLNGVTYAKGLGVHANAEVNYDLNGQYDRFVADVGVDDEVLNAGSVIFQVWADGVKLFDSGLMAGPSDTQRVDVDVTNRLRLKLVVLNGGDDGTLDHADWADAKLLVPLVAPPPPPATVFASDLPLAQPAVNQWGPVERDRSNGEDAAGDGKPITLNGTTYAKGLGVHADSEVVFNLNGQYAYFQSDVGLDDEVGSGGSVVFQVWADGEKLYDGGEVYGWNDTRSVDVPLFGKQQLRLVVTHGADHVYNDHADWANARLTLLPGAPPPATLPAVSVADAQVVEGDSGTRTMTFTVTRSSPLGTTSVNWATAAGTATAGTDYVTASGQVLFLAGETTKTVAVTVKGDTTTEANETLSVNLGNPVDGVLGRATAVGTIVDDDTPAISINDVSAAEGKSGTTALTFTISRTKTSGASSVKWATANGTATAGSDYAAAGGTVSFSSGQATKTVSVTVTGDTAVEPDERFYVNLSQPTGGTVADAQGVGTIVNDDITPMTLQAESAALTGATVATQYSGYTGTGYVAFRTGVLTGDTVTWTPTVALGGTRTLAFRFANGATTAKTLELRINGTVVRSGLSFAATGGWGTWTTLSLTVNLPAGANTIRLASTGSGGPNLDSLIVS